MFQRIELGAVLRSSWRTWTVWDHNKSKNTSGTSTRPGNYTCVTHKKSTRFLLGNHLLTLSCVWHFLNAQVKWITVLYSDFNTFTKDQEYLISLQDKPWSERFDYVEGFVSYNQSAPNTISYTLEVVKNYDRSSASSVDQVTHISS